jgi:hypothetical protein
MKGLKCNDQTRRVSIVVLVLYILYGIINVALTTFVLSLAIFGILYGMTESLEYGVLGLLTTSLVVPFLNTSKEGFADAPSAKEGSAKEGSAKEDSAKEGSAKEDSAKEDSAKEESASEESTKEESANEDSAKEKSAKPKGKGASMKSVTGVASSSVSDAEEMNPSQSPMSTFTGSSTPASADPPAARVDKISESGVPPANMPANLADGFENKGEGGLFKLGKIPTDEKGGFHIDTGTSVLNALKSLKPDQISAMTQDTKQLIETQKTLMNMLQSFKPMMSEGKEMMDTFQQMFSSSGGSALGSLQAANKTLTSQ